MEPSGSIFRSVEAKTADDGELLVRGPNVMKGYFRLEKETAETIDGEGWLHTGDIAQIDSDGFIKITDRKKEIIVLSGGKNISPANLETKLVTDQSHFAGVRVRRSPQTSGRAAGTATSSICPKCSKRKASRGNLTEEMVKSSELRSFFQARLREFNKPLSDVEAIAAFTLVAQPFSQENGEMTPTMKVRRRIVQQHYKDTIDSMFRD